MSTRPVAVRPPRPRPGDAAPAASEPPPSSYGAPPPEQSYWERLWERKKGRFYVGMGLLGILVVWALFMDLTGR